MSFLNITLLAPFALLGLLALAIPIYLHMRHKPRAEVYKFPAIDFLLKAQKKRKRRFQIEQLLLMLFRIGILGLLAFLFAKPFMDNSSGGNITKNGQPMVIVLDDSVSMLAGPRTDRFFNQAVNQIRDLLRERGSSSQTRLLLASNPATFAGTDSAGMLLDELSRIKATTLGHQLDLAYREALDLVEREGWPRATIQIFTDGSLSAWGALPEKKPDEVDVIYRSMRDGKQPLRNLAITRVSQAPGDTNSIEVSLLNSGDDPEDFRLRVDGTGVAIIPQKMRLEAHTPSAHRFTIGDPVPATITLSLPEDDFDLDNKIIYAPKPNQKTRILIVDGDSHPDLVKSESFFFKNALGLDESEKYGFSFVVVTPPGLTAEKASAADVICVLNTDEPASQILEDALAQGKGLFISMGDRMVFEEWNGFFSNYDLRAWEPKLLSPPEALEIKNFDHPLFPPIEEIEWRSYLQDVAIEQFRIMSVGRSNFDIPLGRYDGSPLLLSKDLQPGRLMIWTSTIDLGWNNFPLQFGFVPFVRQMIAYLSGRESSASFQSMTVSEAVDSSLLDALNLKYSTEPFKNLDVSGPLPGIYTQSVGESSRFVQLDLDPGELDFKSFDSPGEAAAEAPNNPLEQLGFRGFFRTDLAPSLQWWLFILVLVETLVAARLSLIWGAR